MSSLATKLIPLVTVGGGPEYASRVADTMAAAFSRDPLTAYLLREPSSRWPNNEIPRDIIRAHLHKNVLKRAEAGAQLAESGNFAAAALWFPPGIELPVGENVDPRTQEARDKFSMAKAKHLNGRKYWYLSLIGRHPDCTDVGVVRALIEQLLKKARADGLPVWLEAVSEHSRQVYEHFSFRTMEEIRLGVGRTNSRGELDENGEGIMAYAMLAE